MDCYEEFPTAKFQPRFCARRRHDQSHPTSVLPDTQAPPTKCRAPMATTSLVARHFVQAPKERVVQGSDKWKVQISRSIKFVGYVFITIMLTFSVLSFAGVTKARIVLTQSMEPTINPGDIVLSLNPDRLPPKVGDIATYTGRRFDGTAVASFTHRIISGDAKNGFVMKGDNNPAPDTQKPTISDISGVVFYTIPLIGKLLTPRGLLVLVPSIFGLWLVIDALRNEK